MGSFFGMSHAPRVVETDNTFPPTLERASVCRCRRASDQGVRGHYVCRELSPAGERTTRQGNIAAPPRDLPHNVAGECEPDLAAFDKLTNIRLDGVVLQGYLRPLQHP